MRKHDTGAACTVSICLTYASSAGTATSIANCTWCVGAVNLLHQSPDLQGSSGYRLRHRDACHMATESRTSAGAISSCFRHTG